MIRPITVAIKHINANLIEQAKDHFGLTTDFRNGAWLLPDGTMLDFSGDKHRKNHSAIKEIFTEDTKQDPEHYIPENDFYRKKFLETGAIRLFSEGGGVEASQEPTEKQFTMIVKFFKWSGKDPVIDLSGKGARLQKMFDNDENGRTEALTTIEKYFKGHKPEPKSLVQQYHYADEERRHLVKSK